MLPREKAAQLVVDNQLKVKSLNYEEAVQCALITVEEIIKFGNDLGIREPMMYWNKVKEEIEKNMKKEQVQETYKYTEEDIRRAFDYGYSIRDSYGDRSDNMTADKYIQYLQQSNPPISFEREMTKEEAKDKLIELLYSQVVDLTLMSKIELGDDVIEEIKRLKSIINE